MTDTHEYQRRLEESGFYSGGGPFEEEPNPPVVDYINVQPSDEGYANIAIAFLQNTIEHDVYKHRRQAVRELVGQALTITAYLAQHGRGDLAKRVIDSIEGDIR